MPDRGPLPFMKDLAEARALCEREGDSFYVDAFLFEAWLGMVSLAAAAEYAEKKRAKDRTMQSGNSWQVFGGIFAGARLQDFPHIMESLCRFSEYDDVQSRLLRQSAIPLSREHEFFRDYVGPQTFGVLKNPVAAMQMARRTVERWCDWLDALIHFQTHASWHCQPARFDPDPEKRELAALGINQRNFAELNDFGKTWWQWHHGEAAERFKASPKWSTLGKAMADESERVWNYPDLDGVIISIWPLLKKFNWT